MVWIYVGIGGAIGACARYGFSAAISRWAGTAFPFATLTINILGSLLMGLFVGWLAKALPAQQEALRAFFAVGVLGGFTTFSAFSLETVTLMQRGETLAAGAYVVGSVVLSVTALFAGLAAARLM